VFFKTGYGHNMGTAEDGVVSVRTSLMPNCVHNSDIANRIRGGGACKTSFG
jgi:hypothetical protein